MKTSSVMMEIGGADVSRQEIANRRRRMVARLRKDHEHDQWPIVVRKEGGGVYILNEDGSLQSGTLLD